MKVKEIIEKLKELDPELEVFVKGYEGGYDEANVSDVFDFRLNVYRQWYYGKHEIARPDGGDVKGVIIEKTNYNPG